MSIAAIRGADGLELREHDERKDAWVTLHVEECGLCGTDLKILEDPPGHPFTEGVILGHEIVGTVDDHRYVVEPNITCGRCTQCTSGAWMDCPSFTTIGIFRDGGFAKTVQVPYASLHPVPDGERAAVLAEPASCVLHAISRLLRIASLEHRKMAILGGGIIGQIFQALWRDKSIIEDPSPLRRAASQAALPPGAVEAADIVVDAYGGGLSRAVEICRPGGIVMLFGMNENAQPDPGTAYKITRKELTVLGAYVGQGAFPDTVAVLPELQGVMDRCATFYKLADIGQAIDDAREGKVVKAIIRP